MLIDVEFKACLMSCKSQDYTFDDGKTATGYRVGIMLDDGECNNPAHKPLPCRFFLPWSSPYRSWLPDSSPESPHNQCK